MSGDEPCAVCVAPQSVTVSERVGVVCHVTVTRMAPAPAKGKEAVESSGYARSPVVIKGVGGAGAVATVEPLGGAVVVVVGVGVPADVPVGAVDCLVTTWALVPPAKVGATGAMTSVGVGGVTEAEPEPRPGTVVVVLAGVEVVGEVACVPSEGAAALRWWSGPWWPDVAAATRARRESDTASTAHQCGRTRSGRVPRGPLLERSLATG